MLAACVADPNWHQQRHGYGVKLPPASYGPAFNQIGGGWYVVERTAESIRVLFWSRAPLDVKNGSPALSTEHNGIPAASFPNTQCDISQFFKQRHIFINLILCGDKASGADYSASGCPGGCVDFVNNNPKAFTDAHFDFVAVWVYE